MNIVSTLRHWAKGIRLYIGLGIALVSLQVWWWASLVYAGDPGLMAARMHEMYGWLALLLLTAALIIGPLYKLAPSLGGKKLVYDARRLFGVGAAWFASLHVAIAYIVSFEAANPLDISDPYRQAFLVGAIALLILLTMAFTSFNAAMKRMGIWWFRVHRLVYAAVVLAVWHAFAIGVHATSITALAILIGAGLVLFIAHVHVALQQPGKISEWQLLALVGMFVLLVALSNFGIQQYIDQNALQEHLHR